MTMALEGGEGSASCPGHSLPTRKTRYPLYRRLGGPQGQSGQVRKISPPPGLNPHNVQPVASCYTDYATWPTQHVIAVLIMFSYKLKGISRAGPRHVGTSGRLIIWPLGRPIIWYPLKLQTFFDWGHSWWTFLRVHAQIVDNFEKKKKKYFAYGNWRLLPSYLWLLQWCRLLPPYLLLFQWCLSTPSSCLAHVSLSTALNISTAHRSLSVLWKL